MGLKDSLWKQFGITVTPAMAAQEEVAPAVVNHPVVSAQPSNGVIQADAAALEPFEKVVTDPPNGHVAFATLLDEWKDMADGNEAKLYQLAFKAGKKEGLTPQRLIGDITADEGGIAQLRDTLLGELDRSLATQVSAKRDQVRQIEQQIEQIEQQLATLRQQRDAQQAEVGKIESMVASTKARILAGYTAIAQRLGQLKQHIVQYAPK